MSAATQMESAEIRARMRSIRSELPYNMDDAREQMQQFTDWKFYVRKMPITSIACVAAAAYLAVPSAKPAVKRVRMETEDDAAVAKSSLMGGLVGAVASMALRTGTNLAIRKASSILLDSPRFAVPQRRAHEESMS
jgi:hypothetical protein